METAQTANTNCYNEVNTKSRCSPLLKQLNVCFTLWWLYFNDGLFAGTPTVARSAFIKQSNATNTFSDNIFSWITAINGFSGTPCIIILTLVANYFGRKQIAILITIVNFIAATVLYFSENALHILINQIIFGIGMAGAMTVLPMILTEYTSTKYRGIFLALKSATFYWGIWTANALGIYAHYRYISILVFITSSYATIASFFIPESPYWLASQEKYDECVLAHRWLKGCSEIEEKELKDLISTQKENIQSKKTCMSRKNKIDLYLKPDIWKPVALSLLVFVMYDFSGKYVCAVYIVDLMKKLTENESASHTAVMILDGVSVVGMYIGCGLTRYCKRRTILLVNSAIGATFLYLLSFYLYLIKLSILPEYQSIIIMFLSVYSLAICSGPMIMITCIFGELLPVKARSFSACCTMTLYFLISSMITKFSPLMFESIDIYGSFMVYGTISSLCIIIAYKYLPETKDKSLYEIAAIFKPRDLEKHTQIKLLRHELGST